MNNERTHRVRPCYNPYILFWIDSDGNEGQTFESKQDVQDYLERNYPGEIVDWDTRTSEQP